MREILSKIIVVISIINQLQALVSLRLSLKSQKEFIILVVKSYRGYKILQQHLGNDITCHFRRRYLQVGRIMDKFLLTLKVACCATENGRVRRLLHSLRDSFLLQ